MRRVVPPLIQYLVSRYIFFPQQKVWPVIFIDQQISRTSNRKRGKTSVNYQMSDQAIAFRFIACNHHESLNKIVKSISRKSIFTSRIENLLLALLNKQYECDEDEQNRWLRLFCLPFLQSLARNEWRYEIP